MKSSTGVEYWSVRRSDSLTRRSCPLARDATRPARGSNSTINVLLTLLCIMDLIDPIIDNFPVLTASDLINADDSCPICLVPFSSILSDPESGVTKLDACNHIFCRKEYVSRSCSHTETQFRRQSHGMGSGLCSLTTSIMICQLTRIFSMGAAQHVDTYF
jgi:hypothetical protein